VAAAAVEPKRRDLGDGEVGALDAFAAVHAREQLGALGFGVGFAVAFGGLPDLAAGGVAVGEFVAAGDGFAGVSVDALVHALGDAHPPWMWSPTTRRAVAVLGQWVVHGRSLSYAAPPGV
jgi:hypothetical protein